MSFAGRRAFEACDVKVVEFKDFVYVNDETEETVVTQNPSEDSRVHAGNSAVLHCPRTEDDRVSIESQYTDHPTRLEALKSLRKLAGELLCRDCRYASMTPVQVSIERRQLAEAEAARLEAHAALQEARTLVESLDNPQI